MEKEWPDDSQSIDAKARAAWDFELTSASHSPPAIRADMIEDFTYFECEDGLNTQDFMDKKKRICSRSSIKKFN